MIKFDLENMKYGLDWKSNYRWDDAQEYVGSLIDSDILKRRNTKEAIEKYPWELLNFGGYLKIININRFKEKAGLTEAQKQYPNWFFNFISIKAESGEEEGWELKVRISSWKSTGERNYDQLVENIRSQNILWNGLDDKLRLFLLFEEKKLTELQLNTIALHLEQKAEELNQNEEMKIISGHILQALEEYTLRTFEEERTAALGRSVKSLIYKTKSL